ncbi:MAG: BMC domain-containing protein [Synergistaceae bacterium]|jgi:microcompartment protein CcmL/EutN|nr:BMC domain-containing protein [Synergistaceae bacterium]
MDTIGFVELSSIASGIEIADAMLKTANINLVFAKASCPGKYYILINGQVANVEKAINVGIEMGKGFVVSSLVLPKIHQKVILAINMSGLTNNKVDAIGVMEFYSVTSSLIAADTAVKAAPVNIIDIRLGTGIGGKSFVVICGDTSSVKDAVDAASSVRTEEGMLVNKVIVSKPDKKLLSSLF